MINIATETTDPLHKYIVVFDPYYIYSPVNSRLGMTLWRRD